jgi:hypothetical protein
VDRLAALKHRDELLGIALLRLRAPRCVNGVKYQDSFQDPSWPSIHPQQSAVRIASVGEGRLKTVIHIESRGDCAFTSKAPIS